MLAKMISYDRVLKVLIMSLVSQVHRSYGPHHVCSSPELKIKHIYATWETLIQDTTKYGKITTLIQDTTMYGQVTTLIQDTTMFGRLQH